MSRAALASQFLMFTNLIKIKTRKTECTVTLISQKNSRQMETSLTFLRKYIFSVMKRLFNNYRCPFSLPHNFLLNFYVDQMIKHMSPWGRQLRKKRLHFSKLFKSIQTGRLKSVT